MMARSLAGPSVASSRIQIMMIGLCATVTINPKFSFQRAKKSSLAVRKILVKSSQAWD
jgi:hypothetical protein